MAAAAATTGTAMAAEAATARSALRTIVPMTTEVALSKVRGLVPRPPKKRECRVHRLTFLPRRIALGGSQGVGNMPHARKLYPKRE